MFLRLFSEKKISFIYLLLLLIFNFFLIIKFLIIYLFCDFIFFLNCKNRFQKI